MKLRSVTPSPVPFNCSLALISAPPQKSWMAILPPLCFSISGSQTFLTKSVRMPPSGSWSLYFRVMSAAVATLPASSTAKPVANVNFIPRIDTSTNFLS